MVTGGQQNTGSSANAAPNPSEPSAIPALNGGEWEERLAHLEAEAENVRATVTLLRAEWETAKLQHNDLRTAYDELREAVLRYAVACAATDVQVAMLRARGDNHEAAENLRRCVDEQTQASDALRTLARAPRSTR